MTVSVELLVALRFLREGSMQSMLMRAGVTGGVAVIIFLTPLINPLQSILIDRVLGSQAHVVIRLLKVVTQRVLTPSVGGRSEALDITGLLDMGNRDLNRRWVFVALKLAQTPCVPRPLSPWTVGCRPIRAC